MHMGTLSHSVFTASAAFKGFNGKSGSCYGHVDMLMCFYMPNICPFDQQYNVPNGIRFRNKSRKRLKDSVLLMPAIFFGPLYALVPLGNFLALKSSSC